jgi:hypothetical protein
MARRNRIQTPEPTPVIDAQDLYTLRCVRTVAMSNLMEMEKQAEVVFHSERSAIGALDRLIAKMEKMELPERQ